MDEADILCDRKAMLTLGQVVCVGSSEYLKQIYNTGYTLSVEKATVNTQKEIFEDWFQNKGVYATCVKSNDQLYDFKIAAKDLSILSEFEKDVHLKNSYVAFSVQENGLEEIFTSKELVDEKDITISKEEQKALLDRMDSFADPSTVAKTIFFFKFEFKRFLASIVTIVLRMILTISFTIVFYVLYQRFATQSTTSVSVSMPTLLSRLMPSGFVLETDIADLISQYSSVFVPLNTTGSTITVGKLVKNGTAYVTTVYGGFAGASLLSLSTLFPDNLVSTVFEYVTISDDDPNSPTVVAICAFFMYIVYSDLVVTLSDDVCDSREKIKFLLLSTGVPLKSYWFVTLIRSFLISLPFNILITARVPPSHNFAPVAVFFYLLQPIFLSAVLGSLFPRTMVRGIATGIRIFGFLFILVAVIVGGVKQWGPDEYEIFVNVLFYLPTTTPLSLSIPIFYGAGITLPSTAKIVTVTVGYLVLYVVILAAIELQHLVLKRIPATNSSFVSFNAVTKKFGTKTAVNNLNLQIEQNEMFAMLGPNGCGKTTSLSMLTAQTLPTAGSIHMDRLHCASQKFDVIKRIGFCPQFDDLLIPNMTVTEHLELFCSLNGLPDDILDDYIS
ncbi:ATP-binding cassette sub- A member 12, partial [Terramyces sp. JEL0728]